ncbi:hypothetical protein LTR27_007855 [Elasticomyces elasticus]|nr:hypothetical protein LTR27_007855 [Elasticomyces elasticus]
MQYTASIIAVGLAIQQTAATGWDVSARGYSNPANTNNESHKRDALSKRGFQSKCIAGGLDEKPSISCDGQEDKMSIDTYHISSSENTDIDCHYDMPDGSTCKETHSCSSEGSIIQNSQCGGAKGVTFQPAGGASSGCTMSIHSIGFNCGSASSSVPVATPTPSPSSSSTTAETTSDVVSLSRSSSSVETSPATTTSEVSSVSTPVISSYASSTTAETTSDVVSLSRSSSSVSSVETSPVTSSESSAITSSISTPVISSYGSSTTAETTSDVITNSRSSSVETSPVTIPTSYPVYNISSSSSSEASPVTSSSASTTASIISYSTSTVYSTTCSTSISSGSTVVVTLTTATSTTICPFTVTETGVTSYSSSSVVSPVTNSTSTVVSPSTYPTPDTPDVLPSCLNTWMYETGCKDNSDSDCYCKDAEFVKHVYGCISAWAGSNEDTTAAASQFMGICAPYVPANPAVITGCPSTITPVATPTPYVSSSEVSPESSSAPAVPSTITYYSTQEVTVTSCAADITNCPASSTVISVSSVPISTSVVTPSSSSEVSPASSSPTGYSPPAYMTSESLSSAAATTPAPSTITFYSTQEVTVTSCGPEVTNCPASSTVVSATSIAVSTSVIIPTYSGVTAAPSSSLVSPASDSSAATSPESTPAPPCPVTTLTYSSPVTIPATYSTGVSSGLTVANSSITTSLVTTVTVPQVVFTTQTVTANGQTSTLTGLAAGGPSSAAATPTVGPVGASPPAYATTMASSFGTSFAPSATGTGSPIQPYTGAGVKLSSASFAGLAMGAVAALFVL